MAKTLGPGTTRYLDPQDRAFTQVILQKGKPVMDAEWNLLQELPMDAARGNALRSCPSGFLSSPFNPLEDYATDPAYSNWFRFGRQQVGEQRAFAWALVNGWLVPVTGTRTGTPPGSANDVDTWNKITLDPPPSNAGDFRFDFVFLEVWQARIPPNPSSLNKPAAGSLYRYGNVEGGASFLADDLIDPSLQKETAQRVQLQYRIRVVSGLVGLALYPDGFDPTSVKAQGGAASPTAFSFTNMREAMGDPGLWRAGNGLNTNGLNTVDGYVYAVPICGVFRRNSIAWNGDPSPNLNGGVNRNPTAIDRTGVKTFSTVPTLAAGLSDSATLVQIDSSANIPLPLTPAIPLLIRIGDELMTYSAISGSPPIMSGLTRGVNGTKAEAHLSGTEIQILAQNPYGLFSDQVVLDDIYDMRHLVCQGGFDYTSLLQKSVDKLLRGQLKSTWKRTGSGLQGTVLPYQDKIVNGSAALGITKLDGPDNCRLVYSDAAVTQKVTVIVKPNGAALPAAINSPWSLTLNASHTVRAAPSLFSPGDEIVIPIGQLKSGLPGSDIDQIRWLNDGTASVQIRVDGWRFPLDSALFTASPIPPTPVDDLVITLGPEFPTTSAQLFVTATVMYGPGRGLSHRPHEVSSVSFLSASSDLLLSGPNVPTSNQAVQTSWSALWSRHLNSVYKGQLPTTSESFVDLGSKTVIVCPFRRIDWPDDIVTIDGTSANPNTAAFVSGIAGVGVNTTVFQDAGADFSAAGAVVGDLLVVGSPSAGRYQVTQVAPGGDVTKLVVDFAVPTGAALIWNLYHCQGVMPLLKADGATPKWMTTDPLGLFSGTTDPNAATKNLYVTLPRQLIPGWGAYHVPIVWQDGTFAEGINYLSRSLKGGAPFGDEDKNYVPYSNGPLSYCSFSTVDLNPPMLSATYNGTFSFGGVTFAGIRRFTDSRGLGRKGLELPPFYGIARLFAVYEATDYKTNGSSYDATTRAFSGSGAVNLLRQTVIGPSFWVEIDSDGDSTFVLNADCLDLSKAGITVFENEDYVVEASIWGFDRGTFDSSKEARVVLTRPTSPSLMRSQAADLAVRANNTGAVISGPVSVLSGPMTTADSVVINYQRIPYQGDAWGTQTSYVDTGYAQGPLTTAIAYQLSSTDLDRDGLTRPNQKAFEVLASMGFTTSLGTGRLSGTGGSLLTPPIGLPNVGYEDPFEYPPTSPSDPRPQVLPNALQGELYPVEIGTDYLGCTERLPLGALFRDKDFRGGTFSTYVQTPLVYHTDSGVAFSPSLSLTSVTSTASAATGAPGDVIVHVDGEQGNYSLLTNYRVTRGGSAFSASGPYPGGEVACVNPTVKAPQGRTNVLSGRAMLVRSFPTDAGGSEVSVGDELLLLIITTVTRLTDTNNHPAFVTIGTNGTQEGYSAADYYRLEGHPLIRNHNRLIVDVNMPLTSPS